MASLKSIRKRIRSVKNTQQITKAMKMVAAARLRRAQEAILATRPYAVKMDEVLEGVATRANLAAHPLLARREMNRVELVVVTSDRGLCGGFNANVLRRAQRFLIDHADRTPEITLRTVGRKAYDFFKRRPVKLRKEHPGMADKLTFALASDLAHELTSLFLADEVDGVFLVYNEFVTAISQRVTKVQLLPVEPPEQVKAAAEKRVDEATSPVEYEYEPGRDRVLGELLPRYMATKIWRALLESAAAEHGARMSAMDAATSNATDMIDRLTLLANRTRQAVITKELMEIVSGAEALK